MGAFLRHGIDVCSTAMTPWVWPAMTLNPPSWIEPITEACEEGGASCFTTGIDPGFANDLFPMTLMGLCAEVRSVKALEILDYINYTGDYEEEMGIGRLPDFTPLLEHSDILVMSWGATVPMMAHAVGIELDRITTTWDKWVTPAPIETAKGVINAGEVAAIHFTINGILDGETRIALEHVNRVGTDAAPDWPRGTQDDVYRVEIEGSPSITPGNGLPLHRRQRTRCRRRGLPGHRPARPERGACRQRPGTRMGHRARPAPHRGRRHHPLTGDAMDPAAVLALCHEHAAAEAAFDVDRILRTLVADPVYEFYPANRSLTGWERVETFYRVEYPRFAATVTGFDLLGSGSTSGPPSRSTSSRSVARSASRRRRRFGFSDDAGRPATSAPPRRDAVLRRGVRTPPAGSLGRRRGHSGADREPSRRPDQRQPTRRNTCERHRAGRRLA